MLKTSLARSINVGSGSVWMFVSYPNAAFIITSRANRPKSRLQLTFSPEKESLKEYYCLLKAIFNRVCVVVRNITCVTWQNLLSELNESHVNVPERRLLNFNSNIL
jgi:2-phospho-L-lactate guanylyltransferase (CobY/MobA/RfbA family)